MRTVEEQTNDLIKSLEQGSGLEIKEPIKVSIRKAFSIGYNAGCTDTTLMNLSIPKAKKVNIRV